MPDPAQGLISLDVSVTGTAGKPISGLSEKDFTLLDNSRQQKIVTFQAFNGAIAQPANSLEIVLVIDELNSLTNPQTGKTELSAAVHEVENFLQANGGMLPKPTIVYRLTSDGLFATRYASMDGNQLVQEIRNPAVQRRIWAAAAMKPEDAGIKGNNVVASRVAHSLVALGSIAIEERRKPGRKLMFWIGNGWQTDDVRPPELPNFSVELLTRLSEARITLWSASKWPLYAASGKAALVPNVLPDLLHGPKVDPAATQYLSLAVIATRTGGGELNTNQRSGRAACQTRRRRKAPGISSPSIPPAPAS
jgi:hypothetical protein